MRETKFSIVKALAIICVVLSHAGIRGWLSDFVYIFHVPVFFLCAGYFFNTKYLTDEYTYIKHRVRGLYFPFVRWSLFFLLIHNLMYTCGILSETYGNAAGGVMHPYTWHQFAQHMWSIVFNMSGYDQFLGCTFWFFRALLLASIAFLFLFKIVGMSERIKSNVQIGWGVLSIGLILTTWKVAGGLNMTGVAQGGYRELMGMSFMAAGFLIRQYDIPAKLNWKIALPCFAVLLLASFLFPSSMMYNPNFVQFISLPVPAIAAFLALIYVSGLLDVRENFVKRSLVYIGERTLYVFAFSALAFKVVSALKVAWYDLPWEAVGGHPVVINPANNVFWVLLYVIAGVGIPLLWLAGYRKVASQITITQNQALGYVVMAGQMAGRFIYRLSCIFVKALIRSFHSLCKGIKEIIAASSVKDE